MNILNHTNKQYLVFAALLLLFVIAWFLLNDSEAISRDEMFYASYSLAWSDADTKDIRHVTEHDYYSVSMQPVYKALMYSSISLFGKNITGLRFFNLVAAIIILISVFRFGKKFKFSPLFFIIFFLMLLLVPKIRYYYFLGRPDFILMSLIVLVLLFVTTYTREKKNYFLYFAAAITGFSCGIYWNGIALLACFGVLMLYLLVKKTISLRIFLFSALYTSLSLFLFFLLPLIFNWDNFIPMLTGTGFQTKDISEGTAIRNYPVSLLRLFWYGFTNGILIIHGIILISTVLISMFYFLRSKNTENKSFLKELSVINCIIIVVFILITAFRGDGEGRYVDNIMIPIFIQFAVVVSFSFATFKTISVKILALCVLTVFFGGLTFKVISDTYSNYGQTQAYEKYSENLRDIIKNTNSRVFTSYESMWALPNPKLYLEIFINKKMNSYQEMSLLFKKYNVDYILLDERSKDRMKSNEPSYVYWRQVLENEFKLIGSIRNKYYRSNKEKKPANGKEYVNEIWQRK